MPIVEKNNFITENISVIPNEVIEKTEDEKVEIKTEQEQEEKITEHKNAVTKHVYKGNNAILLDEAMKENNYKSSEWVGSYQAKKLNKQVKENAKAVEIKVFYEKENSNDYFMKIEKIYNVEELENIKKIEETSSYIEMIEELKKVG